MENCSEEENKINFDETFVNLHCVTVKEELNEEAVNFCDSNEYKIKLEYETISGETSSKTKLENSEDNLTDSLHNDTVIENTVIKCEDIKIERSLEDFYCNTCNGDYKGYCIKCSTLSRILNNTNSLNSGSLITTPIDILEIRVTSVGKGVFLLKRLPKGVIFGPFQGISITKSTEGYYWKIEDNKLLNINSASWMNEVICAENAFANNLNIFQDDGELYYQTNKEIMEGEELLIYFDDEEIQKRNNECHFIPKKQQKVPKLFACTLCGLGFSIDKCLMEHKSKCPHVLHNRNVEKDLELIDCHKCNIWLEKLEHQEYHMAYCWQINDRMPCNNSEPILRREIIMVEEMKEEYTDLNDVADTDQKCNLSDPETSDQQKHVTNKDNTDKQYQCNICSLTYANKYTLASHVNVKHTQAVLARDYKCSECFYQTNNKSNLKKHSNIHSGVKSYQCDICMMKFTQNSHLKTHINSKHREDEPKDYKCSECSYQTNDKRNFHRHNSTHSDAKPFQCGVCGMKFKNKEGMAKHIRQTHNKEKIAKKHKCPECSYETNYNGNLRRHINNTHAGIKQFQCDICMKQFSEKQHLKGHTMNMHAEAGSAKKYKCTECSYQTNYRFDLNSHMHVHTGTKPFECDICHIKFIAKANLNTHMKNKHPKDGSVKDFKCSECAYQTNYKYALNRHMNTHTVTIDSSNPP